MIRVGFVSGTFEPQTAGYPRGMLAAVARELPNHLYECRQIPYPADFGRSVPFADSMVAGRRSVREWVQQQAARGPEPIWLVGYSQGAVIVGDVIARHPNLPIAGVVLLGDGLRAWGEHAYVAAGVPPGYGLAGERPLRTVPIRSFQLALPDDPICSAPRDSLLRDVADLVTVMSMRDPIRWAADVGGKLVRRELQNLTLWENTAFMLGRTPARVDEARKAINGYLHAHTAYGTRRVGGRTYCQRAGEIILRG